MTNSDDPDDIDNIRITSKENFDLGPYALYQKLMEENPVVYTKMKAAGPDSQYYNKWYIRVPGYSDYIIPDTDAYRTSVQGFPILMFHTTKARDKDGTGEEPVFIGRYNMLLDKGSAEAYGFDVSDA
jgi:hypothetical protein